MENASKRRINSGSRSFRFVKKVARGGASRPPFPARATTCASRRHSGFLRTAENGKRPRWRALPLPGDRQDINFPVLHVEGNFSLSTYLSGGHQFTCPLANCTDNPLLFIIHLSLSSAPYFYFILFICSVFCYSSTRISIFQLN